MIAIAPADLCSGLPPGSTVKLADLLAKADIRDHIPKIRGGPRGDCHPLPQPCLVITGVDLLAKADIRDHIPKIRGGPRGDCHPLPQPCLVITGVNYHSKHFYQNSCWCAGGKCERCKARECKDRNWREQGREVP